jgi:hypothetical protein
MSGAADVVWLGFFGVRPVPSRFHSDQGQHKLCGHR